MATATLDPPDVAPAITAPEPEPAPRWALWQRVLFRFVFVYMLLQITPWSWFSEIPGIPWLMRWYQRGVNAAVYWSNDHIFHIRETLVLPNGSGDTSWSYTEFYLYLTFAALVCAVWSVLDRKRAHHERLGFWFRMIVRYYLAMFALTYGIIKIFALQMPFPTLSMLATPLGDLLPMRFSWAFIGYSFPYQVFSGVMETTAGLLLLYRRTVTAGLLAAMGAFLNVLMINLSYDVPVKLFAAHLLFAALLLLALDHKRLLGFFVLNRTVPATSAWNPNFARPWQHWGAVAVKVFLVWQFLIVPMRQGWERYQAANRPPAAGVFARGFYDVRSFVINRDTAPASSRDTLRWKDVIFDNAAGGSVNTTDQMFWQRYRRGYFRYRADTAAKTIAVWKTSFIPRDSTFVLSMRYEQPDTNTIRFHTTIRGDSVHMELIRIERHFQLAERQFHWVSEYNR